MGQEARVSVGGGSKGLQSANCVHTFPLADQRAPSNKPGTQHGIPSFEATFKVFSNLHAFAIEEEVKQKFEQKFSRK